MSSFAQACQGSESSPSKDGSGNDAEQPPLKHPKKPAPSEKPTTETVDCSTQHSLYEEHVLRDDTSTGHDYDATSPSRSQELTRITNTTHFKDMMVGSASYEQAIIDTHRNLCTRLLDLGFCKIPVFGSITRNFLRDEMENAEEVLEDEVEQ